MLFFSNILFLLQTNLFLKYVLKTYLRDTSKRYLKDVLCHNFKLCVVWEAYISFSVINFMARKTL